MSTVPHMPPCQEPCAAEQICTRRTVRSFHLPLGMINECFISNMRTETVLVFRFWQYKSKTTPRAGNGFGPSGLPQRTGSYLVLKEGHHQYRNNRPQAPEDLYTAQQVSVDHQSFKRYAIPSFSTMDSLFIIMSCLEAAAGLRCTTSSVGGATI